MLSCVSDGPCAKKIKFAGPGEISVLQIAEVPKSLMITWVPEIAPFSVIDTAMVAE